MKKIFSICLIFLLIFCFEINITTKKVFADAEIEVLAESAYLCDYESGTVVFAKNENLKRPIASMTKIMLLVLAFEKNAGGELDFNKDILVSKYASSMGGSQVFLQADKYYKCDDLIKSIIIASANDASVAIAEALFGNENNAVNAMNQKAKELKMHNTLFSNCTGLTRPTQYSSAKDVAIMLTELCKYKTYFDYSKIYIDNLTHPDGQITELVNTNKLIRGYEGCDGGKTGFTSEAGFCLAGTAKRGNMRGIGVVINGKDSKSRFTDCAKMLDYLFQNFSSKAVLSKENSLDFKVAISKGEKTHVGVIPKNNFYIFGKKNEKENVKIEFEAYKISAPIKEGNLVGRFTVYQDGIKRGVIDALASESIARKGIFDIIKEITIN